MLILPSYAGGYSNIYSSKVFFCQFVDIRVPVDSVVFRLLPTWKYLGCRRLVLFRASVGRKFV